MCNSNDEWLRLHPALGMIWTQPFVHHYHFIVHLFVDNIIPVELHVCGSAIVIPPNK